VEWYDYAIYGYLATALAPVFFPELSKAAQYLGVFVSFAVAFLLRPFGAVIFGHLGDRYGRRAVLIATVALMSIGTFLIGAVPGYSTIGVAAPILLTVARCMQGLSAGGEAAGAAVFLVEYAPPTKRALYASPRNIGAALGSIVGAAVALAVTAVLSDTAFDAWGWRIPFLLSVPLGVVAYFMRRTLDETPQFKAAADAGETAETSVWGSIRLQHRAILILVGYGTVTTLAFYIFVGYMVTYLVVEAGVSRTFALWSNLLAVAVYAALCPVAAILCDRFGRRPILIGANIFFVCFSSPLIALAGISVAATIISQIIFAVGMSALISAHTVVMVELFPAKNRYSGSSIGLSIGGVIGGAGPLLSTYLISVTGSFYAPGLMVSVAAAVSLIVVWVAIPETGNRELAP
jgi:MHS family proline/betaine transporter-like MFS transporter